MAHQQSDAQQNPKFLLDSLYCSEEHHWEDGDEDYFHDQFEEQVDETYLTNTCQISSSFPVLLEQDLYWDEEELKSLLSKQEQSKLYRCLESNSALAVARREAVEWMLKVSAHYSFSALTAILAVNYLDRFLFSFHFENGKPWMTQLVAVTCLSLAAKVEETQVPLLLDLQVCLSSEC